ncbi:hypothetical protein HOU02_gp118 [Caulobacter phage CcrBL9]|uniref:Uncharacterized protein n=1 Tax=Caulobacter phage CcrBL9 TaxID=2283270 RepID=A0A385EE65_9CAUD|nr:hypothetical protein HOU02_gp118 [Caulobacter phage CcrBL9]AXQ69142.1 hypothetical protein CcrBL9_gp118 [Caulobacter phage CcrBL9]
MSALPVTKNGIVDWVSAQVPHWMPPAVTARYDEDPENGPVEDFTSPASLKTLMAETIPFGAVIEEDFYYRIGFVHGALAHGAARFDWPEVYAELKEIMRARRGEVSPATRENRAPEPAKRYKHPDWYEGDCPHLAPYRIAGGYDGEVLRRFPLRYGSAEVEVCTACDAYRLNVHNPKTWWKGPYAAAYAKAMREMEEEC